MLPYRGGDHEELAGEYPEWWHAENGERSQHQRPAEGGAGVSQTANLFHLLGAGGLGGMSGAKKDGGLGERVNDHMQHRGKVRDGSANAKREGDQAHVFNGGIGEESFDIALPPEKKCPQQYGEQSKTHQHVTGK